MTTYTCRLAAPGDIEAVAALRMAYLREAYGGLQPGEEDRLRATNIAYLRERLGADCLVSLAEDGSGPVSCAYMNFYTRAANRRIPDNLFAEVYGVYTLPGHRQRGLASRNMSVLLEEARSRGAAFVQLEASADGFGVYRRLGFQADASGYTLMKFVF